MANTSLQESKGDDWNDVAEDYFRYSSGPGIVASKTMLERLDTFHPFSKATGILDNGCGPGPITTMLIDKYGSQLPDDCSFLAGDFSDGMIKQVQASRAKGIEAGNKIWPRVETQLLDATDMQSVPSSSKSHVTAGWVYMLTPDPAKCLSESIRVLQPGGALACTSWDRSDWMDIMFAAKDIRPGMDFPAMPAQWTNAELLKHELESAGFMDVQTERVPVTMSFEKHGDLVDFFTTKIPVMVQLTKDWSDDEKKRLRQAALEVCKKLTPEEPGELHGVALLAIGRK